MRGENMGQLATATEKRIARPLDVLVPLIKQDLLLGTAAAERAGMPHYMDAGAKLLEAKPQIAHGNFQDWVKRNIGVSMQTAEYYMRLADHAGQNPSALGFSSMSDFIRKTSNPNYNRPPAPPSWHAPVQKIVSRVDTVTLNLAREELKRADEREAQRKLGLQLIDIGYKVLARKLHPDKGGSRDAMARLNAVRDRLKANF